jgi:hypothetical protein
VHLLEKRSFELALAEEDRAKSLKFFGLVLKSRETTTRERIAEVQKQKLALKQKPVSDSP